MTYNDWITQLKNCLLNVSEAERKRVLDYYAEAYADRRADGYSESEIIDGFGAPYDAAQNILSAESDDTFFTQPDPPAAKNTYGGSSNGNTNRPQDYTWLFVLLCIVCAVPLFGLIMTMVGITIGFAVLPFSTVIAGVADFASGIFSLITGELYIGIAEIGSGVILVGVSIILFPICFALIKLMWKLFNKLFNWLKKQFKGGLV